MILWWRSTSAQQFFFSKVVTSAIETLHQRHLSMFCAELKVHRQLCCRLYVVTHDNLATVIPLKAWCLVYLPPKIKIRICAYITTSSKSFYAPPATGLRFGILLTLRASINFTYLLTDLHVCYFKP